MDILEIIDTDDCIGFSRLLENNKNNLSEISTEFIEKIRTKKVSGSEKLLELTSLKRLLSRYRNQIKKRNFTQIELTTILAIIDLKPDEKSKISNDYSVSIDEKRGNRFGIENPNRLIQIGIDCLSEKSYLKQTIGVILLTGRRPNEVLLNGNFFYGNDIENAINITSEQYKDRKFDSVNNPDDIFEIMDKYHNSDEIENGKYLLFSGQSKQSDTAGNRLQPFPIPLLNLDSDKENSNIDKLVMSAIDTIREKTNFKQTLALTENDIKKGYDLNRKLDLKTAKSLTDYSQTIFKGLLPRNRSSMSELRAIYQCIAYQQNHKNNQSVGPDLYCSVVLGHRPSSKGSSTAYNDYYCL
jgi:hypothetical protein